MTGRQERPRTNLARPWTNLCVSASASEAETNLVFLRGEAMDKPAFPKRSRAANLRWLALVALRRSTTLQRHSGDKNLPAALAWLQAGPSERGINRPPRRCHFRRGACVSRSVKASAG